MNYTERLTEDRRLQILRTLAAAGGEYTANEVVLAGALHDIGHAMSRDQLRGELGWLEEQGLLIAQQPGGVWVVTLSARGYDAAAGTARVPGIARPRPA